LRALKVLNIDGYQGLTLKEIYTKFPVLRQNSVAAIKEGKFKQ